jgi:general secretion pathway protein N
MSTRAVVVLATILFAFTVLLRAPARWLLAALPTTIECQGPAGTLWRGSCAQLQIPGGTLNQVSWSLHPWPLLRGHLDADLRSADARAAGTARASLHVGGDLVLTQLHAQLPIDSGYMPFFPVGWSGQVELALDALELSSGTLVSIAGTVTARSLARRNPPMSFGSFELHFAPGASNAGAVSGGGHAPIRAELRDLGGPLAASGTLIIRNGREYLLSGPVAVRPEGDAELAKIIEYIGPPDAQGRRTFTLEGSF